MDTSHFSSDLLVGAASGIAVLAVIFLAVFRIVRVGDHEIAFFYERHFMSYCGECARTGIAVARRRWIVDKFEVRGNSAIGVWLEFTHEFRTKDPLPYPLTFFVRGRVNNISTWARQGANWRDRAIKDQAVKAFSPHIKELMLREILHGGKFVDMTTSGILQLDADAQDFMFEVLEVRDPNPNRDAHYARKFHYQDVERMRREVIKQEVG